MTIKTLDEMQSMLNGSRHNANLEERQVIALETIAEALLAIIVALRNQK